jgi:hypothetical protein
MGESASPPRAFPRQSTQGGIPMKPSKRQDAPKGPERGQGDKPAQDRSPSKDRPEELGPEETRRERLEKEREILGGSHSGGGEEAGQSGDADAG